jgi:ribosome modulation factor
MDDPRIEPLPGQAQLPGIDPEIPATNSRALAGAWRKGHEAALAGKSMMDCPYRDKRSVNRGLSLGRITWSRAFRKWWRDGFESVTLFPRRSEGS